MICSKKGRFCKKRHTRFVFTGQLVKNQCPLDSCVNYLKDWPQAAGPKWCNRPPLVLLCSTSIWRLCPCQRTGPGSCKIWWCYVGQICVPVKELAAAESADAMLDKSSLLVEHWTLKRPLSTFDVISFWIDRRIEPKTWNLFSGGWWLYALILISESLHCRFGLTPEWHEYWISPGISFPTHLQLFQGGNFYIETFFWKRQQKSSNHCFLPPILGINAFDFECHFREIHGGQRGPIQRR